MSTSTLPYDSATDPYRIDVELIRRTVWSCGEIPGFEDPHVLVHLGRAEAGGKGRYGAVLVMVRRTGLAEDVAYSTHQVIVRSEADSRRLSAQTGHYDMSRAEAEADLAARVFTL